MNPVLKYAAQIRRLFTYNDVCRATRLTPEQAAPYWDELANNGRISHVGGGRWRYVRSEPLNKKPSTFKYQHADTKAEALGKAKVNAVWQSILQNPGKLLREYQTPNISINTMYSIGRALEQGGYIVRKRHCCWPITDVPTAYIRPIHKAVKHA